MPCGWCAVRVKEYLVMPKVSQLAARKISLVFTEDGEEYEIVYKPFRQELLDTMMANADDEDGDPKERVRGVFNALKQVLIDWNMFDDDGGVLPIDDEGLALVHMDILNLIWTRITEDMNVGKRKGSRSVAPLRRVG